MDSFEYEVQEIVARDVIPSIEQLKRRLASPPKRVVKHLVSDWQAIVTGVGVPLSVWLMTGVTLPWSILWESQQVLGLLP